MRSTKFVLGAALLGGSAICWARTANAQATREAPMGAALPAPSNAFELKFGAGYTQGFGNIAPDKPIHSVSGAGVGLSVDFDWRLDPWLSAGIETQYQEFATENNAGSRGLALNVGVTYHLTPMQRSDPWLRIGTGYRFLWDSDPVGQPGVTNMFHGFDLATVKVGYDFRTASDVAFAPVIGANLQTFIWNNSNLLASTQWGSFIYAGIQGRFDTGVRPSSGIARR
jgi:hypothetical protein